MSYVDGMLDRKKNVVKVIERIQGKRIYKEIPCEWVFFYDDPKGKYQTIFRSPVSRFSTNDYKEYQKEIRIHSNKKLWESDINQVNRVLSEHYLGKDAPKLNVTFFDIEVDFSPGKGFSKPEDPFNKITAISLYHTWCNELITLAIPPRSLTIEQANKIAEKYSNCYMFEDEADLLDTFLSIIEDTDVLSGWNSEGYDIPYLVNRIERILSKNDTRRLCLWDQLPYKKEYERYGKDQFTYELSGRIHVDSLALYRQYTYHEMHSHSLDAIAEYELNERKVQYTGTLDQLYNNDFPKFLEYNRQDTMILKKLDDKLRFIDLANELAHDNTVLIPATMGAVAVTEQAVINYAHSLNLIVPDKVKSDGSEFDHAAGAYVANPKRGLHKWVGAIDINSLYPSAIRALNMSPETLIGQIIPNETNELINKKIQSGTSFAEAWEGLFGTLEYQTLIDKDTNKKISVQWNTNKITDHTGEELYNILFNNPWMVSANGTIFTYENKGIVPGILEKWYKERKQLQLKKKESTDPEQTKFWDKRQLVKKINLNSLYGAILNKHCRFYVFDIGQSTTLTGRCITKHMASFVNESFTGKYDHVGKTIIAGDTDSVYFSVWPTIKDDVQNNKIEWNKTLCVQLYDQIALSVNESFPKFMKQAFNCPEELGLIIQGGRELVATSGLFIKKKRYGLMIYDSEGERLDLLPIEEAKKKKVIPNIGKVKAMGMDLKRSDTPDFMQDFLMELLVDVLCDETEDSIVKKIVDFKYKFKDRPSWEKGTPKRVNNLTHYTKIYNEKKGQKGITIPGHVAAAIAWNKLLKINSDRYSQELQDGQKTIVCKLKGNPLGFTSVSYPIDQKNLPDWFKELPFDDIEMLNTIVDKKVDNLIGVLKMDISRRTNITNTVNKFFTFT